MLTKIPLFCGILVLLAGCQNLQSVKEGKERVAAVTREIEDEKREVDGKANRPLALLEEEEGAWLARRSVAMEETDIIPARFYQAASFTSGRNLPLSLIVEQIAAKQGITIHMSGDMLTPVLANAGNQGQQSASGQEPKVQLNYSGTLRGLLDALANRSGTYWTYREGGVIFARYKTRTFQIASMPGTSNFTAIVGNKTKTGGEGGGGSDSDTGMSVNMGGSASVAMKSDLGYWDEANATIKSMLSPAGKSTSSTVTNSVTVTDTAEVIDRVRLFIDRENAVLGRQVSLQVRVFKVALDDTAQSGIDWNLAIKAGGFEGGLGMGTDIAKATGPMATVKKLSGIWADSQLIIKALQSQGDVSTVIDTSIVTLNNQPAPLAVTNNQVYLAKLSVTRDVGLGIAENMYTADPANLTTGFILNLLPTLLDNRSVLLQVQLSLSSLNKMEQTEVGKDGNGGKIGTPETSAIQTLQRASLKSGETLLMTGFRREVNDNLQKGLFTVTTGYADNKRKQEEFIVLITPQLIEGV